MNDETRECSLLSEQEMAALARMMRVVGDLLDGLADSELTVDDAFRAAMVLARQPGSERAIAALRAVSRFLEEGR